MARTLLVRPPVHLLRAVRLPVALLLAAGDCEWQVQEGIDPDAPQVSRPLMLAGMTALCRGAAAERGAAKRSSARSAADAYGRRANGRLLRKRAAVRLQLKHREPPATASATAG